MNLALVPWILSAVLLAGAVGGTGWYRMKWLGDEAAISSMKAQEAENVAKAVQAVAAAKDADAIKTNALVVQLQTDLADQQKAAADAQTSLATAPVVTVPQGCPDPMASPLLGSFLRSLPD